MIMMTKYGFAVLGLFFMKTEEFKMNLGIMFFVNSILLAVGLVGLLVQGVATSIDALSVGFTIADYNCFEALLACLVIAITTFFIFMGGLAIGKKAGTKLAGKASILGGAILVFIGIEIFIKGII